MFEPAMAAQRADTMSVIPGEFGYYRTRSKAASGDAAICAGLCHDLDSFSRVIHSIRQIKSRHALSDALLERRVNPAAYGFLKSTCNHPRRPASSRTYSGAQYVR